MWLLPLGQALKDGALSSISEVNDLPVSNGPAPGKYILFYCISKKHILSLRAHTYFGVREGCSLQPDESDISVLNENNIFYGLWRHLIAPFKSFCRSLKNYIALLPIFLTTKLLKILVLTEYDYWDNCIFYICRLFYDTLI